MNLIRTTVISNKEPVNKQVLWIKPEDNDIYSLLFFELGEWKLVNSSKISIDEATENYINKVVEKYLQESGVTNSINSLKTNKQDTLISGKNIKTINSKSILGSGNIFIDSSSYDDSWIRNSISTLQSNKADKSDLNSKQDLLVSGLNIATINNLDITKGGNINIESGSSGTTDYKELINKPQINRVELIGNKSLEELGIQPKGTYLTEHQDISGKLDIIAFNKEKEDFATKTELSKKQDTLISGTNLSTVNNHNLLDGGNIEISGGASVEVIDNLNSISTSSALSANQGRALKEMVDGKQPILSNGYSSLGNKPQINNVTLDGNKSLETLGIQPKGSYLTASSLEPYAKKEDISFYEGVNGGLNSIINLPITKRSIDAAITNNQQLSLSGNLKPGQELYIRVQNNKGSELIITLPDNGNTYISMVGNTVKVPTGKYVEISVWCYKANHYSIRVGGFA